MEPPCDPEEMTVWISEDGGEWTELEHDDCISVFKTNLVLYGFLLKDGSSYRLQADYTGGRTNMFSFTFDKNIVEYNFSGGDRDGGDLDAAAPPEVEQPVGGDAPVGDAPVVDTPVIVTESSEAASAVYTGKRIDFMRNGDGGINVSRSTFDLEIPKETLDALVVGKNDTLSVSVTRGENGEITVALAKNGQPVDDEMCIRDRRRTPYSRRRRRCACRNSRRVWAEACCGGSLRPPSSSHRRGDKWR